MKYYELRLNNCNPFKFYLQKYLFPMSLAVVFFLYICCNGEKNSYYNHVMFNVFP